jgi:LysR family hydrogen peroxide-inducible transcriptional activator
MEPSLKQLKYLLAVSEWGHFGKAAAACNVTQSTLSAGIHDLENILEVQLFERTKKKVLVTETGQAVIDKARVVLQATRELVEVVAGSSDDQALSGNIRLAVIPTIAPFLLPPLLAQLRKQFPALQLYLREAQTEPALEELYNGRVDAVLMATPYPTAEVSMEPLFEDHFYLACLSDNKLAKYKHLKTKHLEGQPLLLLEDGHCLRQHALSACKLHSADYSMPYQATSLITLVQMVANGLGITLLPEIALKSGLLTNTTIEIKAFSEKDVTRTISLVWRPSSAMTAKFKILSQFIREFHATHWQPG